MALKVPGKKQVISHFVALALGFLGGLVGHDLSPLQKPAEVAAEAVVDKAADAAGKKIEEVVKEK